MGKLLDEFKNFIKNATPEELDRAWKEVEQFKDVGPTVEEYVNSLNIKSSMTKEDYMKLSKERLAELLAERDEWSSYHDRAIAVQKYLENDPRPLCGLGGFCTNPHRDCINCPGVYPLSGTTVVTTTNTHI